MFVSGMNRVVQTSGGSRVSCFILFFLYFIAVACIAFSTWFEMEEWDCVQTAMLSDGTVSWICGCIHLMEYSRRMEWHPLCEDHVRVRRRRPDVA